MELIDQFVSLSLQVFNGFLTHAEICDERKVFLSDDPEVIGSLFMFLSKLAEVVVLCICVEHKENG